jgi:hypothetical protein
MPLGVFHRLWVGSMHTPDGVNMVYYRGVCSEGVLMDQYAPTKFDHIIISYLANYTIIGTANPARRMTENGIFRTD